MKRLSICTSLSGVRPMMTRPIRSGISCTVRPSVATSSRATAVPGSAPAAASAVSGSDCGGCGCCCCCCVVGGGVVVSVGVEAVLDVALGLRLRKRLQVKAQPHALHELCELGRVELVVELGLPGENDPQHLVLGGLDTREQADLLQHAHGEVLRLVDDQQHLAPGGVLLDDAIIDRADELGLAHLE